MWAFLRRKLFYNSCFPDCWICIGKSSNSNLSLKDPRKLYKSWWEFLGLQSRDKVAMLGSIRSILPRSGVICLWVNTMEFFLKEFTWKQSWAPKRENCFYSWPPAWPPWCHVQTSNNIASNNWSQSTVPPPPLPPSLLLPLWQDQTFHQRVALLGWPKNMWVGLELSDQIFLMCEYASVCGMQGSKLSWRLLTSMF